MRLVQKVDEATKKIQAWDGADSDNLVERITTNDTSNSEADNIYVGFTIYSSGYAAGDPATVTIDNFVLVTP